MSAVVISLITLGLLITLIMIGFHIGIALMTVSILGIYLALGQFATAIAVLDATAYSSIREYIFGVIPLFVLMGLLANLSGASQELYTAANELLKRVRGGVGLATIIANAVFAAITGVSIASAAVFTKISVPQMTRLGYHKRLSVGVVAGSSILGMLIPPSILMIVYGALAEQSVGALFIAAVIPGLLMTLAFIITLFVYVSIWPETIGGQAQEGASAAIDWSLVRRPVAIIALIFITMGGIWFGWFTPTEAGGLGSFGALLIVIMKGRFSWKSLWETLLSTGATTGAVLFLLITAQMYSRALAISGVINSIEGFIHALDVSHLAVVAIFMAILMLLGCILDSTSILLLTMPVMVPIIASFHMNLIWFGIVAIIAIETGLLTPPFGLSVYTVKSSLTGVKGAENISVEDIFLGSTPYLIAMVTVLFILVIYPDWVRWL
jgi:tripartite ATP-independent transporter DctM subunit